MIIKQKFVFDDQDYVIKAQADETLLDAALRSKLPLMHSCGGMGTCGTCRIVILKGGELLPPLNEIEVEIASDRQFQPNERLACQNYPTENLVVEIPKGRDVE